MRYHYPQSTGWIPPESSGGGFTPIETRNYDNPDNQVVILGVNEVNATITTPCNCFTGTPYVDANGNCTCIETVETVPTKPIYLDGNSNSRFQPKPLQTVAPNTPQPKQAQTIVETLKANPVLVGIAVLAGILLIKK